MVLTRLDVMRGWYLVSVPRLRSLQGGGEEHFIVGLDDLQVPVGDLEDYVVGRQRCGLPLEEKLAICA